MINTQNQKKVFIVIIAILLVANVAMLAFFLQKKEPEKPQRPDRKTVIANFLKNDLGFNQQQLIHFDTLSKMAHQKIGALYDSSKNKKNEQFKKLAAESFTDSAISFAANEAAASQKIIELQMLYHIKSIRQLCTPGQLPKFDSLFYKVFNKRGGDKKK